MLNGHKKKTHISDFAETEFKRDLSVTEMCWMQVYFSENSVNFHGRLLITIQ